MIRSIASRHLRKDTVRKDTDCGSHLRYTDGTQILSSRRGLLARSWRRSARWREAGTPAGLRGSSLRAQYYFLRLSDMRRSQSVMGSRLTGGNFSRSSALRTQRSAAATRSKYSEPPHCGCAGCCRLLIGYCFLPSRPLLNPTSKRGLTTSERSLADATRLRPTHIFCWRNRNSKT
jgi:hypothetical protein